MKSKSTSVKQPWRNSMFTSPISKYSKFLPSISGQSSESSVSPIFAPYTPSLLVQQSFTPKKSLILTASQHPLARAKWSCGLEDPSGAGWNWRPRDKSWAWPSPGGRTWTLGYGYVMNMWILWMCTSIRNFGSFCCRIENDRTCITYVWISNGLINRPLTWDMWAG